MPLKVGAIGQPEMSRTPPGTTEEGLAYSRRLFTFIIVTNYFLFKLLSSGIIDLESEGRLFSNLSL